MLFNNGNMFEKKINDSLKKLVNIKCKSYSGRNKYINIFNNEDYLRHRRCKNMSIMKEKYKETLKYMNEGVPIISQVF